MSLSANTVTIHPYFKAHAGRAEAFRAALPAFIERTTGEAGNLFYEFSANGDEFFCREGYTGAEAVLAHLDNVGALLTEALKIADLARLEFHGPAAEIAKLKEPLAALNPAWFIVECRLES